MSKKPIPNGDQDFLSKAESFARTIASDPAKAGVSQEESDAFNEELAKFKQAYMASRFGRRSAVAIKEKELAREAAETRWRRLRNEIAVNKNIDPVTKFTLEIPVQRARAKQQVVPQEPPRLRFVQALHKASLGTPMHELAFTSLDNKPRPEGAVRVELFVDLVAPEEPIPTHPGMNTGSRPWYLRSYTKSPIILVPPMANVAMRVVYWARWADSQGNVGPFSGTCVGWIEGGVQHYLPGAAGGTSWTKRTPVIDMAKALGPAARDRTYVVAVLEAQYQSMHPQMVSTQLPAPEEQEQRRLEGPAEEAAA